MAIIVNLDVMLAKRKVQSKEIAESIGLSENNFSRIKTGRIKAIRFSTLNALCRALDCKPGDILDYVYDEADELEDIGYYETIDGDGASFVEWGEKFPSALPYGYLEIAVTVDADGNRTVRAQSFGDRARQLLFVWAKDSKSRLMKAAGCCG